MIKFLIPLIFCSSLVLVSAKAIEKTSNDLNPIKGGQICSLCVYVFSSVQDLLEQNKTDEEIIQFVEKEFCNRLGPLAQQCNQFIETNAPIIIFQIANKINSDEICSFIGVCGNKEEGEVSFAKNLNQFTKTNTISNSKTKIKTLSENFKIEPLCTICQYAVKFIEYEIKNNQTEQAIVATLDKVCKIAPTELQIECDALINTYGIYFVEIIINGVDPEKVCKLITIC